MKVKRQKRLTVKYLEKLKVPKVLIAGLIMASVLGWAGWRKLEDVKNYYLSKRVFPLKAQAVGVLDGDTFVLRNGLTVRLLGIDAPARGKKDYKKAKDYLGKLVVGRQVALEYDQYQDDKYGRILAYVWIDCLPDLKSFCRDDKLLVNEVLMKKKLAKKAVYEKRKRLKYDGFLQ